MNTTPDTLPETSDAEKASSLFDTKLRKRLKEIFENEADTIRAAVSEEALDHDDPALFFDDLQSYGCISGLVGSLIYYTDTQAFYDAHYAEIEQLREDWEDDSGEPLKVQGDLKNFFAWFAFEKTAYRMAINDLSLEM